jgi:non-specific serine/threonine protein kinase
LGIDMACNNLGSTLFHLGEPARAGALHREALASYRTRGIWEGIAWSLERLGVVEAVHGDARRAARLLGAASVARGKLGKEPDRWDASDLEHASVALQETLGPEAWNSAWEEGRTRPLEQSMEYALNGAGA